MITPEIVCEATWRTGDGISHECEQPRGHSNTHECAVCGATRGLA